MYKLVEKLKKDGDGRPAILVASSLDRITRNGAYLQELAEHGRQCEEGESEVRLAVCTIPGLLVSGDENGLRRLLLSSGDEPACGLDLGPFRSQLQLRRRDALARQSPLVAPLFLTEGLLGSDALSEYMAEAYAFRHVFAMYRHLRGGRRSSHSSHSVHSVPSVHRCLREEFRSSVHSLTILESHHTRTILESY